jgi:L-cysteine S-thiosulfotransferase
MMNLLTIKTLSLLCLGLIVAGCASITSDVNTTAEKTREILKASFADKGQAKLDRLDQSALQLACSQAAANGKELDKPQRTKLEAAALATVKTPSDGLWLGDWKEGEKVAQSGRGMQFTDAAGSVAGGNCYACHQMTKQEISYGNIGPSLLGYGKLRSVKFEGTQPSAESLAIVQYTWGKLWNSHAYNACSNMPRFGDAGILTEVQLKQVMALLLSPESPVNQ